MARSTSGHANRKRAEAKRMSMHEIAASAHNQLHSHFFGIPHEPVREIRSRLDPILQLHAIREITKESAEEEQ